VNLSFLSFSPPLSPSPLSLSPLRAYDLSVSFLTAALVLLGFSFARVDPFFLFAGPFYFSFRLFISFSTPFDFNQELFFSRLQFCNSNFFVFSIPFLLPFFLFLTSFD